MNTQGGPSLRLSFEVFCGDSVCLLRPRSSFYIYQCLFAQHVLAVAFDGGDNVAKMAAGASSRSFPAQEEAEVKTGRGERERKAHLAEAFGTCVYSRLLVKILAVMVLFHLVAAKEHQTVLRQR